MWTTVRSRLLLVYSGLNTALEKQPQQYIIHGTCQICSLMSSQNPVLCGRVQQGWRWLSITLRRVHILAHNSKPARFFFVLENICESNHWPEHCTTCSSEPAGSVLVLTSPALWLVFKATHTREFHDVPFCTPIPWDAQGVRGWMESRRKK